MIKIYDKKGNLIEVQLYRTEQHYLMKENLKLLRAESNGKTKVQK